MTGDPSRIAKRRESALAEGGAEYISKRNQLIRAAAAVFREKGFTTATLNDIAARFGTDRASLYYYVGSKEELYRECIRGVLDDNLVNARHIFGLDIPPREKLRQLVEVLLSSYEQNYPFMYVYIQEDMSHIASSDTAWATKMAAETHQFEKIYLETLEQGVADGSFRSDLPVGLVANSLFGMLNWTHRWFVPGKKFSTQDLADVFMAVFLEGMDKH